MFSPFEWRGSVFSLCPTPRKGCNQLYPKKSSKICFSLISKGALTLKLFPFFLIFSPLLTLFQVLTLQRFSASDRAFALAVFSLPGMIFSQIPTLSPFKIFCSNVTFLMRHTLMTLVKTVSHPSPHLPLTVLSYSAFSFFFYGTYHFLTCIIFLCIMSVVPYLSALLECQN